jgi:hypothetical protein
MSRQWDVFADRPKRHECSKNEVLFCIAAASGAVGAAAGLRYAV